LLILLWPALEATRLDPTTAFGFLNEPFTAFGVGDELGREHLECNFAV